MPKTQAKPQPAANDGKIKRKLYEKELRKLQVELCHVQDWVKAKGLRVIVLFEGRDAAGKGGTIKAITERVSPRVFRVVALPAPSDREKTQMYAQRYVEHFPAAGEIVIFDRSWYNRAGVEHVMGFADAESVERFLKVCPEFERYITDARIVLIKFWLEVGQEEQERRFLARINDSMRQWKLSPMDWNPTAAGMTIHTPATGCSRRPTPIARRGISSDLTTKDARGSTASRRCSTLSLTKRCGGRRSNCRSVRAKGATTIRPPCAGAIL